MQRSYRDRTDEFFAKLAALTPSLPPAVLPSSSHDPFAHAPSRPLFPTSHPPSQHSDTSSSSASTASTAPPSTSNLTTNFTPPQPQPHGQHEQHHQQPKTFQSRFGQVGSGKYAQPSKFAQASRGVGHDIHRITSKLERLAKLAQTQSLFMDPTSEIQQLTHDLKGDIGRVKEDIDVLENWVHEHHSSSRQSDSHSQNIVNSLKRDLADRTKNFAEILQTRTQNLKRQSARGKRYGGGSKASQLRKRKISAFGNDGGAGMFDGDGPEQSMQQALLAEEEDDYLRSRVEAVEQIESTIVELGEMYQRLSMLVAMQGEVTLRIDANVEETLGNVEEGHQELLKYFDSISSNRWLIIKVFAILIAFAIFFVMFVA